MSKELAVLIIHGMGSQSPSFADGLIAELCDRVDASGADSNKIAWQPIYWANILDGREMRYFREAKRQGNMDYLSLREFVLTAFGDASAYQKVDSKENTTYQEIHQLIDNNIEQLFNVQLDSAPKPMVILAHSLGGHIMSNYIWDKQKSKTPKKNSFEDMEYLSGMVTFGCNIPLFTFAYENVIPIEFPPHNLAGTLKQKSKWLNFYDPDDVLGYPLKAINDEYDKVVTGDFAINVGGVLSSWNPLSHNKYWTDNDFTKPVSEFLTSFLNEI